MNMNMISKLRKRVQQEGKAEITPEEFDQLQAEWITRVGAEEMVLSEREACAKIASDASENECDLGAYADAVASGLADSISERILERSKMTPI